MYQTSFLCPATRAAGLKGSSRRVVADIARRGVNGVGLFSAGLAALNMDLLLLIMYREAREDKALMSESDARKNSGCESKRSR